MSYWKSENQNENKIIFSRQPNLQETFSLLFLNNKPAGRKLIIPHSYSQNKQMLFLFTYFYLDLMITFL